MICTNLIYEACRELFAGYRPAVESVDCEGSAARSMILMLGDGDDPQFSVLSEHIGEGMARYSIRPWPAGDIVDIADGADEDLSEEILRAVTSGVPIPQDGSLFGWLPGDTVTALIAVYAGNTAASSVPSWAVMPWAGTAEEQWPPFTDERLLGKWFWEDYRAGRIRLLNDLIAQAADAVYWVSTEAAIGSGCCAVARDITSSAGYRLRRGRYVYYRALRANAPVPSLAALLADRAKIDLAPRFRSFSEPGS